MRKWEYLRLVVTYRGSFDTDEVNWVTANHADVLQPANISTFYDYLNKLGKDGWEMVNVFPINVGEVYHLKRPIS
jgi:hypothetical protein